MLEGSWGPPPKETKRLNIAFSECLPPHCVGQAECSKERRRHQMHNTVSIILSEVESRMTNKLDMSTTEANAKLEQTICSQQRGCHEAISNQTALKKSRQRLSKCQTCRHTFYTNERHCDCDISQKVTSANWITSALCAHSC